MEWTLNFAWSTKVKKVDSFDKNINVPVDLTPHFTLGTSKAMKIDQQSFLETRWSLYLTVS